MHTTFIEMHNRAVKTLVFSLTKFERKLKRQCQQVSSVNSGNCYQCAQLINFNRINYKSVSVVANLNIGLLPGSVNIIESGPLNETHWRLWHHFPRATVHKRNKSRSMGFRCYIGIERYGTAFGGSVVCR